MTFPEPVRLLVAGDWHGDTAHAFAMLAAARDAACAVVVQLGDFGIWPGHWGAKYLRKVSQRSVALGVPVYFVDGNHEDFPRLYRCTEFTPSGFRVVRPNVFHVPRGHTWAWSGTRLKGVGGAVSIDREQRTPGKSWWPQEALTPGDLEAASQSGPADVLFTHDAPTSVPVAHLKPDEASVQHRALMDAVAKVTRPRVWLHGHLHMWAEYDHCFDADAPPAAVLGLECEGMPHSYVVLDLRARIVELPTHGARTIAF